MRITGRSTVFNSFAVVHDLAAKGFDYSKAAVVLGAPAHHLALLLLAPLPVWYGAGLLGILALGLAAFLLGRALPVDVARKGGMRLASVLVLGSLPLLAAVIAGDTHLLGLSAALCFVYLYYFAPSAVAYAFLALAIALEPATIILAAIPAMDGRRRASAGILASAVAITSGSVLVIAFLLRLKAQPVLMSALHTLKKSAEQFGFRVGELTGAHSLWTPFSAIVALMWSGRRTILVEAAYGVVLLGLIAVAFVILRRARASRRTTLMVALAVVTLLPFDSTFAFALPVVAMLALFITREGHWRFERLYIPAFALLAAPTDLIQLRLNTIALGVGRHASVVGLGVVIRPLVLLGVVVLLLIETRRQAAGGRRGEHLPPVLPLWPYLDTRRCVSPRVLGLAGVLVATATAQVVMYNRFLPIQEGWFTVFAKAIIAGKVPYRDFYLFIPPVYAYLTAALVKMFGTAFIVFRTWGVVERVLLAGVLYLVLEKPFKARSAMVATILGVTVFSSNNSDVIHGYTQFTLILVLAATYLVMHALESRGVRASWFVAIAGLLGGVAFLTKQSLGLFAIAALAFALGMSFIRSEAKRSIGLVVVFIAGAVAPLVATAAWLQSQGALTPALGQVFGGASSKGCLPSVLFGFIGRTLTPDDILLIVILCSVLLVRWFAGRRLVMPTLEQIEASHGTRGQLVMIALAACAGAVLPRLLQGEFAGVISVLRGSYLKWEGAHWAFYCSTLMVLALFFRLLAKRNTLFVRQLFVLAMVSFMASYAYGLSLSLDLASTVPALSLLIAVTLLPFLTAIDRHGARLFVPLLLVFTLAVSAVAIERYRLPYTWWGWAEPSIGSVYRLFDHGPLRGMQLTRNTVDTFERIPREIDRLTPEGSTMFTYPHIPVFYTLADRKPVTFGYVHYYDVMPDKIARADARRLLDNPPDSMVMVWFSEEGRKANRDAFRGGRRSGQDDIEAAVIELLSTGRYVAVDKSITVDGMGDQTLLTVYVKREYAPKPHRFDRPH